jgi:hypothetical protein
MAPFVYYYVSFEVARVAGGWCVEIRCPSGGKVELHDFQTEAGAKAWIAANARGWAAECMTRPLSGKVGKPPRLRKVGTLSDRQAGDC